ncbi:hypothetical protein GALMADRAFT_139097 [Galerina marginata CBS 339.88]|uniref:Uncharacterized protein n=1 Tax=Galerina marginata (strain CBS 339.88) TaxID=685588 RepID=A0A067T419_GALM3|nr:hypothetical protein GALMADRAFT_139097 [Galerina marginata CBS 339.88]
MESPHDLIPHVVASSDADNRRRTVAFPVQTTLRIFMPALSRPGAFSPSSFTSRLSRPFLHPGSQLRACSTGGRVYVYNKEIKATSTSYVYLGRQSFFRCAVMIHLGIRPRMPSSLHINVPFKLVIQQPAMFCATPKAYLVAPTKHCSSTRDNQQHRPSSSTTPALYIPASRAIDIDALSYSSCIHWRSASGIDAGN